LRRHRATTPTVPARSGPPGDDTGTANRWHQPVSSLRSALE